MTGGRKHVDIPTCWGVPGLRVELWFLEQVLREQGYELVAAKPAAEVPAPIVVCSYCGSKGPQCASRANHGGMRVCCELLTGHLGRHQSDRLIWTDGEAERPLGSAPVG